MLWFIIAILGYLLLAVVFVLDKLILTESVDSPVVFTFYSTIFMFAAVLALPFGGGFLAGVDWIWALVSGLAFGFGLWTMYEAVNKGEASHINPFIGAVITILTFLLSSFFLQEQLTSFQLLGMVCLVLAGLFLSVEKTRGSFGFHKGFIWAVVAGLCFAVSHVSAKYLYDLYPFVTGFVWTRFTTGFVALFTLLFPSVRRVFKKKRKKKKRAHFAKRHAVLTVVINKTLGVLGVVAVQYAIAIGSVTLVNAMVGLQYALMFVLIFLLTKFAPKVFKETFTKKELMAETFAIILVVIGSGLFVL